MAPSRDPDHQPDTPSPRPSDQDPSLTRPSPRPPRSQAEQAAIRVRNRRREYLERNPGYLCSAEHELADPLLYDDLVRRFQTPAEREAEGRAMGYGRVLEGSLLRGEARLALIRPDGDGGEPGAGPEPEPEPEASAAREVTAREAEAVAALPSPRDAGEASERWREFLRGRFVRGGDEDFEYGLVDGDEEYDGLARREEEEAWFEEEDPDWASDAADAERGSPRESGGAEPGARPERSLRGQTGVQDF